jgi:hypothetical protein
MATRQRNLAVSQVVPANGSGRIRHSGFLITVWGDSFGNPSCIVSQFHTSNGLSDVLVVDARIPSKFGPLKAKRSNHTAVTVGGDSGPFCER